ncbi:MAG: bifunctional 3-deoxy-7-phosphoheptulonate synthase/chorismate mutase [Proteobacteria bacterium]|nr:bifunctional 3-deoxy-7-phosphoheptulonate synthase/chorismate mutase [Pseudomonadota bacterium]
MSESSPVSSKANPSAALDSLRIELDSLDGSLLESLAQRRELSRRIAEHKSKATGPARDQEREARVLADRVRAGRALGLDAHFVTRVFHAVIEDSLRVQHDQLSAEQAGTQRTSLRLCGLGSQGSYSHAAAERHFSRQTTGWSYAGCNSLRRIFEQVARGEAEQGVAPIENTITGSINEAYDLLLEHGLSIVGEERMPIRHCLLGLQGADRSQLRLLHAHPQALAQCRHFVDALAGCQVQYATSASDAVQAIAGDKRAAAIASAEAAAHFGVEVLVENIADQRDNYTRFIFVARRPLPVPKQLPCKTSLVISTAQKPASLVQALLVFRKHGINLAKLESRPIPGNAWEEMFYLDLDGNPAADSVGQALEELSKVTRFVRFLGSYASSDLPPTTLQPAVLATAEVSSAATIADTPPGPTSAHKPTSKRKSSAYRLASREHKQQDTVLSAAGVEIGGPDFVVIAGPCAVETREQVMTCARHAREHGVAILRGGCFKPRTSPYSFQGLGLEGLDYLAEAGKTYGMPIVTEVMDTHQVEAVARQADILQVGARNMQNFSLLRAVGQVHRPVMLKRGLMASIDELLQAAEYILSQGNQQVFLCERGIRTFETSTRNTLDLSAVPILQERTHLPVIIDPSHAVGRRDLVPPLARAAQAVGAHGVMVEFHPRPEEALSDGPQALRFPQLAALMRDLYRDRPAPVTPSQTSQAT